MEHYPRDVVDRILAEYEADAVSHVHALLEELGADRLCRCALFLAKGSVAKLEEQVRLGTTDFRDLIVAAEYDGDTQVRDFNRPFQK